MGVEFRALRLSGVSFLGLGVGIGRIRLVRELRGLLVTIVVGVEFVRNGF